MFLSHKIVLFFLKFLGLPALLGFNNVFLLLSKKRAHIFSHCITLQPQTSIHFIALSFDFPCDTNTEHINVKCEDNDT